MAIQSKHLDEDLDENRSEHVEYMRGVSGDSRYLSSVMQSNGSFKDLSLEQISQSGNFDEVKDSVHQSVFDAAAVS